MDDFVIAVSRETARTRILVVDDNVDSAEMLAISLRLEGYDSHAVYDGASALEAARRLRPQALLLDLKLPDMSGGELAARIRESRTLPDTIIIAVSGREPNEDSLIDFDGYVLKPAELEKILDLIDRARLKRQQGGMLNAAETPAVSAM